MSGFTQDLKQVQAARGQGDGSVVAPVAPAALNQKVQDVAIPGQKPLSQQDLKVTAPAAAQPAPAQPAAQPTDPDVVDPRQQLSPQDALIVDMSSLMNPIGAQAPSVAPAVTPGGSAEPANSPPAAVPPAEPSQSAPLEGTPPPAAAAPAASEPPPAVGTTFKIGDKEFKSAEELLAYAQGLEVRGGQIDLTQIFDLNKLVPPEPQDPDPADIIFEDPRRAIEIIEKRATDKVRAELRQRDDATNMEKTRANTWAEFYRTYSDLVGYEDIVQTQVNQLPPKMTLEKGLEEAAKKARARVAQLKKQLMPAEVISTRVIAAPANPVEPPAPAPEPAPKPTSMTDELNEMRRQKRGA